jgi:Fic family protein
MPKLEAYVPFPSFAEWGLGVYDLELFGRFAQDYQSLKQGVTQEQLNRAVDTATRWAAIDTGAIEGLYEVDRGFTFSVAVGAAAWDSIHLVKGADVQRAIHDAMKAYEYVLDAATNLVPISQVWIKQLHQVICASQDSYAVVTEVGPQQHALVKGAYKELPNSPYNVARDVIHGYAPVDDTAAEMQRLVDELSSDEFVTASPVLQAAYAHYAFVCIHPFPDGNGRVSRALASVYLYRDPGIPLVIFADQKASYLDALELADSGKPLSFVQFVTERAIDTIQLVKTQVRKSSGPGIQERVAQFQAALTDKSGLRHEEVDLIADRLMESWREALEGQAVSANLQPPLSYQVYRSGGTYPVSLPVGYRSVLSNPSFVQLSLTSQAPAAGSGSVQYIVAVSRQSHNGPEFVIVDSTGQVTLEIFLREINPSVSPALLFRLQGVAEESIINMLGQVVEAGEQSLRDQGYK